MKTSRAFTLIELLVVITIIAILMSLVISVAGMVQTKSSRDRSSAEIAALSAAMESYKADNGIYPQTDDTDKLDPRVNKQANSGGTPDAKYTASGKALYAALSGDDDWDFKRVGDETQNPVYFEFETRKGIVERDSSGRVKFIADPWGDPYGYSTAYAAEMQSRAASTTPPTTPIDKGYNPTFDLWSVANAKDGNEEKWVKNW